MRRKLKAKWAILCSKLTAAKVFIILNMQSLYTVRNNLIKQTGNHFCVVFSIFGRMYNHSYITDVLVYIMALA